MGAPRAEPGRSLRAEVLRFLPSAIAAPPHVPQISPRCSRRSHPARSASPPQREEGEWEKVVTSSEPLAFRQRTGQVREPG